MNARTPKLAASEIEHPKVTGVVHEIADCEGCRIHIARAGLNPAKKCILFIHGFPECVSSPPTCEHTLLKNIQLPFRLQASALL